MTATAGTTTQQAWDIPKEALLPDDPLANCLVLLTRMQHRPFSLQSLTAGLPLVSSRLTPELFVRAAARADISAQIIKRKLDTISNLTLPTVLLLQDGQACILLEKQDGTAKVVFPEAGAGEASIALKDLEERYTGFAIFVKPAFRFDKRAETSFIPKPKHWFWGTVKMSWPIYSEVLVASLLINLFALVMPLFIMNVYDRVVPNNTIETLWVLAIGVGVVYIFDFIMRGLRGYFIDIAGKKIDVILSSNIFEKVMGIRMEARPPSVGAFASSLQEFESFREFITSATITTLVDLPFLILFLVLIWWIGGMAAIPAIVAVPLILLSSFLLQKPLAAVIAETFRTSSQRQSTLIESLTGLETLKAIGAEGPMQRRWEQLIGHLGKLSLKARLLSAANVNTATFLQQMASVGVVIVGVYLISERELSVGALVACTMLTGRALAPLSQVAGLITRYHHARAALDGINRMMALPVEREQGKSFVHRPNFKGTIEFKDVSFNYPEQPVAALQNISFRIAAGERVGVIGRIGSGKTTIEKLIMGLYQPTAGSVWIDGVDLQQIDPADLRRNIAYVPQDPMLFYGTVRNNIVFGAPYVDDRAMLNAAEIAGVSEFVNRHPLGFDMPVGERGEGLSGGQRQSIAVARAMLLDPVMLVLDEPSNSLDNRSEENLKARLGQHIDGKTLLLVTHRASMLTLVNRLIVVDGGRIIADGPKEQVLEALSGGKLHVAKN
ncbi:MAG: type I secretion system permease/ATPase [Methylophilaceae bacterium]|jgi:ATP-binding cassette subfamily C protein LapB|uniref:type I secretion system permease/ATPase n=1 Tax=Methylobacillus sp. MM3 TaxID=1848039 RepID=UPI0009EEA1D6|nr:type I secretion system permease/ATPase [Methylobacillus sp. MM3]